MNIRRPKETIPLISSLEKLQDEVISEMIGALDSPDYPHIALRALNKLLYFDAAATFIYSTDDLVYVAADELSSVVDNQFIPLYSQVTYRFSPFFQHHRSGMESGIYLMNHLARAPHIMRPAIESSLITFDETSDTGYRTSGWPKYLSEIDIAVRLSQSQTVQIALYRTDKEKFSERDFILLTSISQRLRSLYFEYWKRSGYNEKNTNSVVLALKKLSNSALSNREMEAAALILSGYEAPSIAEKMKISVETVKTYRERAYRKLKIRSQSELFEKVLEIFLG